MMDTGFHTYGWGALFRVAFYGMSSSRSQTPCPGQPAAVYKLASSPGPLYASTQIER